MRNPFSFQYLLSEFPFHEDDIMIPKDPAILLSYVNTKLRDEFDSLAELCAVLDVDETDLRETLARLDYRYDPVQHQFI